jgi:hypothetical protein
VADGGLGDVQLLRRKGEAEMPRRGLKSAQAVQEGNQAVMGFSYS